VTRVDPDQGADDLAETFAAVARALRAEQSLEATLEKIVELAVKTVAGCDHAGVSLVERGRVRSPAASDHIPGLVDTLQHETGEGPCLDAIREHEVFQTDDLLNEDRWPNFARRAAEKSGISSILAYRLFIEGDTMGALNLYSRQKRAFDVEDRAVGSIFAAHASVALFAARQKDQLEQAIETRDVIGQAKGILMAREDVTADQAFEILRRGSQRLNIKLQELARQVTTGQHSDPGPGRG
jgi:GAF domain-containing protein